MAIFVVIGAEGVFKRGSWGAPLLFLRHSYFGLVLLLHRGGVKIIYSLQSLYTVKILSALKEFLLGSAVCLRLCDCVLHALFGARKEMDLILSVHICTS